MFLIDRTLYVPCVTFKMNRTEIYQQARNTRICYNALYNTLELFSSFITLRTRVAGSWLRF
jgi:hypothetical protein